MKNIVVTKEVLSPQNFLEVMTGIGFLFGSDIEDDRQYIHTILERTGLSTKENPINSTPLDELEKVVEANKPVILVECSQFNEDAALYETNYYWFETGDIKFN